MSIRESIDRAPITAFQFGVVGTCLLILLTEGYDLLIMAFAASSIAAEWSLTGSQIGLLLSAALVGMALGSAFVAPLADRIGRRPQTLGCLTVVAGSMTLASMTGNEIQLGLCRFVTGIGIGGLIATLPVVIAEFSPQRRRATMVAMYISGLPLGGVIGGLVANALLANYSWRASFVVGAILTGILLVVVYFFLPESIDFLLEKRPPRALDSINRTLRKLHLDTVSELPEPVRASGGAVRSAGLKEINWVRTTLLGAAFFVMLAGFYFATSWTPQLLEQSGFSAEQGISGGMLLNLGGAVASFAFSLFAMRFNSQWLTAAALAGSALMFAAMSMSMGTLGIALIAAIAVGGFTNAAAAGLFALAPDCFPASVRSTGVGLVSAIGRLGAIGAPIVAGMLIDLAWSPTSLFLVFAVPLLLGAVFVLAIRVPREPHARATGSETTDRGTAEPERMS
ncbi:MFS transporter [Brevibacterium casei]|uniref:MFS transporter n=1 Tax=Brevibacterium casei TaxID=33889 RepID=UPI0021B04717|nr:MFS transporter [Brevibacterium casei]MCT1766657.1 MFS transporter [Brevibacterium casei]MCT2358571.1 MFS transporter [Brevibacterium casei]